MSVCSNWQISEAESSVAANLIDRDDLHKYSIMLVVLDIYQIALDSAAQIVHTQTTISKKQDIFLLVLVLIA